jgi:hypothetical protein
MSIMRETYLLSEVLEERHVAPAFHVRSLEGTKLLELGLFWVLVERTEEVFVEDKVLIMLLVENFDVGIVRMNTEGKVRRQRPWGGRPSEEGSLLVVDKRECNGN